MSVETINAYVLEYLQMFLWLIYEIDHYSWHPFQLIYVATWAITYEQLVLDFHIIDIWRVMLTFMVM